MTSGSIIQIAPLLAQMRVTVVVENPSASFKCKAVFQATDDGQLWENPVDLEGAFSSVTRTTAWYTDVSKFKRGLRVGLVAGNVAGTNVEMGTVTLVIDYLLRS